MSRHRLVNGFTLVVAAVMLLAFTSTQANAALSPLPSGSGIDVKSLNADVSPAPVFQDDALIVGQGTATAGNPMSPSVTLLTSYDDFHQEVTDPSAALSAAVDTYLDYGEDFYVQLTTDESPATLETALASSTVTAGKFGDVVVPALGQLNGSDYLAVVKAADQLAARNHAIALLDPPDAMVAQAMGASSTAPLTALAGQLNGTLPKPGSAVLFSSGLLDEQDMRVSAAALVAGLMVWADTLPGTPQGPGGLAQPLPDLRPIWSMSNADIGLLAVAGVNSFRTIAGYGTVLWGDLLLNAHGSQPAGPAVRYVSVRQVLDQISLAIPQLTAPYVFQANDAQTWSQVSAEINSYLDSLWQAGELLGSNAAEAYQVSVGPGATMTAQNLENGQMDISVAVAPVLPAEFVVLTFAQQMSATP